MATDTATGAGKMDTRMITFRDGGHKEFFRRYLPRCRCQDVYHKALVYCLGIDKDTRKKVNRIYDIEKGCVKTECLQEGWQTDDSRKTVRMAFSFYCNGTPSVYDIADAEGQLQECGCYTVWELFCCSYARYFWEAVRIRYPECCF